MSTERRGESHWERACKKALATGFSGFDRIPHELIVALATVRMAAFQAASKGRSSTLITGCEALIAGEHIHHFPLSLWQCGRGDLFDEALAFLVAGTQKGADTLRGALPWEKAVPLSLSLALCQALSKHLAVKWQILRLTLETKAALARGQLSEIFQSHGAALDTSWDMICKAALPLYTLDIETGPFAARFVSALSDQLGIDFQVDRQHLHLGTQVAKLSHALRLCAELLMDMAGKVRLLQRRGHLSHGSEAESHHARVTALLAQVVGDLHAADLGLLTSEGMLQPAAGAALFHATSLLAEGALIFADRWLMPLVIANNLK